MGRNGTPKHDERKACAPHMCMTREKMTKEEKDEEAKNDMREHMSITFL